jgi:hypothetical protein
MSVRRDAAESMRLRILDVIAKRVAICADEEARQDSMGHAVGAATERSAKFEAELLARMISELPTMERRP